MATPTLLGAIEQAFLNDAGIQGAAATAGMILGPTANPWVGFIPETKGLPVCGILHLGEEPGVQGAEETSGWTFENVILERTQIQFQVYAYTAAQIDTNLIPAIKNAFDPMTDNGDVNSLVITNVNAVRVWRKRYVLSQAPYRGENGEVVFSGILDYEYWTSRTMVRG
jgi:hypothetical protein